MSPDEVHVWVIGLNLERSVVDALAEWLADDERSRAATFRHAGRRRAFVASRAALRAILGRYLAVAPGRLRLRYEAGGKPRLDGGGDLRFNLSHSASLAICAVACGREVGADLERVRADFDFTRIVDRFFTVRERRALGALSPASRPEAFFRSWTRKEAYLKARGESVFGSPRVEVTVGPSEPPRLVRVGGRPGEPGRWTMCDLDPAAGYVGTVIAAGSGVRLRLRKWTPEASRSLPADARRSGS